MTKDIKAHSSTPRRLLLGLSLVSLLGTTACSIGTVASAQKEVQAQSYDAERYLNQAREPLPPAEVHRVMVDDGVWTGSTAHRSLHGLPLPYDFEYGGKVGLNSERPLNISGVADLVFRATHIPTILAPDVASGAGGASASPGNVSSALSSLGVSGSDGGGVIADTADGPDTMKVTCEDHLSRCLDMISAHFGLTYTYNGSQLQFSRYITRSYTVHAIGSDVSVGASLNSNSILTANSAGGTSSGSSQNASSKLSVSVWTDLISGVKAILGPNGAVAAVQSTGMLTVTAPPYLVEQVQNYLTQQNNALSSEVVVSVKVLNVVLSNSDNYQLQLSGLFNGNGSATFFGNNGGTSPTTVGSIASAGAATALTAATPGIGLGILAGRYAGTNGVINALSTLGRVSVDTDSSVTTLNGIPAPLQVTNTRGYLAAISVTSLAGSGLTVGTTPQVSLTAGQVTTGFNIDVLPRVDYANRSVLLEFGINISALNGANNGFDTFSSGGQTIQLPNINERNFFQQAEVPMGETLVLTGYSQNSSTATKSGTGTPDTPILGGGQVGSKSKELIVILLTPQVVKLRHPVVSSNGGV